MENGRTHRYRITVEYDGGEFVGWQTQPNGRSVQQELETAATQLFQTPVRVTGAGRTDAGVHARGQVAHFDAATPLDTHTIGRALNAMLPPDVTVYDVARVESDFHARFSASSRAYTYTVTSRRTSLDRRTRWILHGHIDHARIADVMPVLCGTHDFTSFSKHSDDVGHCFCHVFDAAWRSDGPEGRFDIRANRFLHGMVRALMGGLAQVGRGRLDAGDIAGILAARDRALTPMLAPAQGLVLTEVRYDPEEYTHMRAVMAACRNEGGKSEQVV